MMYPARIPFSRADSKQSMAENTPAASVTARSGLISTALIPPDPVLRYFCENVLQGTVAYEAETQKITTLVKGHEFLMHLNSPIMTVDGAEVELSQAPIVDEGYALAPLRAFESAVTPITWLPKIQQVSIIP